MSNNKKRQNRSYDGADYRQQNKRQANTARGPASISSFMSAAYSPDRLRNPLPWHIYDFSLRDFTLQHAEDLILSPDSNICSLELWRLNCERISRLPRDLEYFLESSRTLQQLIVDWTDFSAELWPTFVKKVSENKNLKSLAFYNDRLNYDFISPVLSLPRLQKLALGSFSISHSQLEALLTHSSLRRIELKRMRIETPFGEEILPLIDRSSTLVSELVIEEQKDCDTIEEWMKFQPSILKRSVGGSRSSNAYLFISSESKINLASKSIGLNLNEEDKERVSVRKTQNSLPEGIIATIPLRLSSKRGTHTTNTEERTTSIDSIDSKETSGIFPSSALVDADSYLFQAYKHQVIVVERPKAQDGANMIAYVENIVSTLICALHHLSTSGYLLIVDSVNYGLEERKCQKFSSQLERVTDEIAKRMDAFFNTRRVGVWKTSDVLKERTFILDSRDTFDLSEIPKKSDGSLVDGKEEISKNPDIAPERGALGVWCWQKVGTSLDLEYGRFLLSHALYGWWDRSNLNFKDKKEIQAILEQWFMLRANGEDSDTYPVEEIVKRGISDRQTAIEWVEFLNRRSHNIPLVPNDGSLTRRIIDSSTSGVSTLIMGQFEETLQTCRVDALLKVASSNCSASPEDDLFSMMLRYGTVFGNYRQYSTNDTLFQELVDSGVNCEGFASPFNAQILISNPPKQILRPSDNHSNAEWIPTFGSCYEDSDGIFGSIGSFFLLSFLNRDHVFLNPPTVEAVLSRTMKHIHELMSLRPCTFHVLIPAWDDLEAYQVGIASKYLTRNRPIDSSQFPSQNPYTGERRPSNKKFVLLSFSSEKSD